jgi:hypothetical protein
MEWVTALIVVMIVPYGIVKRRGIRETSFATSSRTSWSFALPTNSQSLDHLVEPRLRATDPKQILRLHLCDGRADQMFARASS